jgi:hypothetical protein
MPAARYWRIIGIETYGGGDLELSEVALYDGASRVDGSATLTSSHAPIAGSLANLKDADTGTTARFAAADVFLPGFALQWDFGADQNVDTVAFSSPTQALFIHNLLLQYSATGADWQEHKRTWRPTKYPGPSTLYSLPIYEGDPYFERVVLLLTADGTVGSTSFTDRSWEPKTITNYLNVLVSDTQVKFGQSAFFNNSGWDMGGSSKYLGLPMVKDLNFEGEDFTIEGWVYPTVTHASGQYSGIFALRSNNSVQSYALISSGDSGGTLLLIVTIGGVNYACTSARPAANVWTHVAAVRRGNTIQCFTNGVGGAVAALPGGALTVPSGIFPAVGRMSLSLGSTSGSFQGYMDDLRVTKGVARYASDFTPPTEAYWYPTVDPDPAPRDATPLRLQSSQPTLISEYTPPAFSINAPAEPITLDIGEGGTGSVVGTVKEYTTPANTPLKRRVRLYDEIGRRMIRETWSDPVTGAFAFTNLDTSRRYTAMAYDHEGIYRALVIDRVEAV